MTTDTSVYQKVLWSASGLDQSKVHTLTLTQVTTETISVDRFDIEGGWLIAPALEAQRVESDSGDIAYSTGWQSAERAELSEGSHHWSVSAGATATVVFDGASVSWVATKSNSYGKAQVLLDNALVATVDLYSPTRLFQQTVWRSSVLPARRHTLTIKVLGAKNASSSGTCVSLDRLDIAGRVVSP